MSYKFLKQFYDSMNEGLYAFDSDGKITHFNPAAQTILGYSEEELLGKIGHFIFHAHHEKKGLLQCSIYKAFLQDKTYVGEEVFLTKDGTWIDVFVRANPLLEEGHKQGYVVFFWAISTPALVENDTDLSCAHSLFFQEKGDQQESEAFYEQIFATANLGIALLDQEGRFVALNPAFAKLYGYSEAELIGRHFHLLVPEALRDESELHHNAFLSHREAAHDGEMESVRKGGKRIDVYATEGLLEHIVGGPYKIMTVFDVTEMVESRRVQKAQEAMLVQQHKLAAMGEIIGHIAHQWRQPLNVLNLTTFDLRCKHALGALSDEKFNSAFDTIESLTEQMSSTISDFMDFYKPNKEKKAFKLHEAVRYATNITAIQLCNEGIALSHNIDETVEVYGLANELQQVILNLLSNAKDAFSTKEIEPKQICLVAWSNEEGVHLCVEDNAGGIEESLLERIFEPYFSTKGKMQGSGIGLYICSMIMKESFGGSIRVENITHEERTIGARFIVAFPRP